MAQKQYSLLYYPEKRISYVSSQKIRKLNNIYSSSFTNFSSASTFKSDMIRKRKCSETNLCPSIQSKQLQLFNKNKISDYNAFLKKIKKQNVNNLPSIMEQIKINKNDPQQSMTIKSEMNYEDMNFKILKHTKQQLVEYSTQIISKFGINEISGKYALIKFIKQIASGYNTVSYHNFSHGFSLMHMFYQLTKFDRKFKSLYSKEQIGFTLIAGLAHDLNHQGTNNMYQIKMSTQLAKIAQNDSVLQKMHIRTLFNIIRSKNITLIDKAKNPKKIKQMIIKVILATDVSKHFKGIQKLRGFKVNQNFDSKNDEHRFFVMEQAFHACDIGNPCLQFEEYMNWAALLSYQFNTQTKLEESHKIEVTQMLRYKGRKQFYEGQVGFINMLVLPLWKQLTETWTGFSPFMKNVENNRDKMKMLAEKQSKQNKNSK